MKVSRQTYEERITPEELKKKGVRHILEKIRRTEGYYVRS